MIAAAVIVALELLLKKASLRVKTLVLGVLSFSGVAAIYTVVHLCNLAINQFTDAQVNYMFSLEATNPLTALFYQLIPYEYWYMYLVFPILGVYLVMVYLPEILRFFKYKKAVKAA